MSMVDENYVPTDQESEKASNGYLMSVIAVMAGLPLPIINLIASVIFFLGNRKATFFVRWHCTQVLLSQLSLFPLNSFCFWWTVSILFGDKACTSHYFAYLFTVLLFNISEFIINIYTAIQVRKGKHIQWWAYGSMANIFCKNKTI